MARTIKLRVPAKINLFLHVTGRRSDGYHTLESIFCPIDWYDDLTLTLSDTAGVQLIGGMPGLPADQDLAVRAADALLSATGMKNDLGVQIALNKHIPAGAGLGGGSADAAFTLLGLNTLLGDPLSLAQLHAMAVPLGADVPFFLLGGPAFVGGIGEELQAIAIPATPLVIIKPPAHLPTPTVFKHQDLTRNAPSVKMSVFGFSDAAELLGFVGQQTCNALQPVAQQLSSDVLTALALLDYLPYCDQPLWHRMTGSGSAVFGLYADADAAQRAAERIQQTLNERDAKGWLVHCATTLPSARLNNQTVHLL